MKLPEEKKVGSTPKECFEEGLPDEYGYYYFEALITNSKFCSPDKYRAHTYFNVCEFQTQCPIANLNYDKKTGENIGMLVGNTIELLPMVRYKVRGKPEYNSKYNKWQYTIDKVWETESGSDDMHLKYLKFLATEHSFNIICKEEPDLVKTVLEDKNYIGKRPKGMQQKTYDKLIGSIREYEELMPIIAEFSQFPEITMNTIVSMSNIASNPKQAFKIIKDNPYILTDLPRIWMEKSR